MRAVPDVARSNCVEPTLDSRRSPNVVPRPLGAGRGPGAPPGAGPEDDVRALGAGAPSERLAPPTGGMEPGGAGYGVGPGGGATLSNGGATWTGGGGEASANTATPMTPTLRGLPIWLA